MKTLVNKNIPAIRITAPEVEKVYDKYYYIIGIRLGLLQENWTLVEEEEPTEGIKGNLEEIPSNVDLEKEIRKHTDLFQADIEYPLRLTAIKFYELGLKARTEE